MYNPIRIVFLALLLVSGRLVLAAPYTVPDASLVGVADLIVVGSVIEATPLRPAPNGDAGYALVKVERTLKGHAGDTVRVNYFSPGFEIPPYSVSDNAVLLEKGRRGLFFLQRARDGYACCFQQDGVRPEEQAAHFNTILADYPVEMALGNPPAVLLLNGANRFSLTIRNRGDRPLRPSVDIEGYFHSTCLPSTLPFTSALGDDTTIPPGGAVTLNENLFIASPMGWEFIAGRNLEAPAVILQTPVTARLRVRLAPVEPDRKDDPGFDVATPWFHAMFGQQPPDPAGVGNTGLSLAAFDTDISLTALFGCADLVVAGTVVGVKEGRGVSTVTLAVNRSYKGTAAGTINFTCRNKHDDSCFRLEIPLLEPTKGQQGIFFLQGTHTGGYSAFVEAKSMRPATDRGDIEKLAAAFPIEFTLEPPLPVLYFHRSATVRLRITNRAAYPIEYGQFMHEIGARYVSGLLTQPHVNQVFPMGFNLLPPVILQPGETRTVTAIYTCEGPPEWQFIAPGTFLLTPLVLRVTASFTPKTDGAKAFAVSTPLQVVMTGFAEDAEIPALTAMAGGNVALTDVVLRALAGRDPLLLNEVIPAIGPGCDDRVIPALIALLQDCPDRVEKRSVVDALVRIGPPAGPALSALLESPDQNIQMEAVRGIGLLRESRAIPTLLGLLETEAERWMLHQAVVEALSNMGEPAIESLAAAMQKKGDAAEKVAEALGNIGLPALPVLQQAAQSPDAMVRFHALTGLARVKDPRAEEALFAALKDPHDLVRTAAAYQLQETGNRRVIPLMLEALKGTDDAMIQRAAWVVAYFAEPQGIPATITAFRGQSAGARWEMAQAIKEYGEAAVPALVEALTNPAADVRNTASWALAFCRDARALPVLLEGLTTDGETFQFSAMALGVLQDPQAIVPLIAALDQASRSGKVSITNALTAITKQPFGNDPAKWQAWWKKENTK